MSALLGTCLLLDGRLVMETAETREGSSAVCLEKEASLLILLVHLHCCLPLYLMRRSLKKLALFTVLTSILWVISPV